MQLIAWKRASQRLASYVMALSYLRTILHSSTNELGLTRIIGSFRVLFSDGLQPVTGSAATIAGNK